MPSTATSLWITCVRVVGLGFGALGLLLIILPEPASALFGIPVDGGQGPAYVRALGIRDIALCAYLLVLCRLHPRATRVLLRATVLIPLGDLALVTAVSGASAIGPLALHGLSGLVLLGLAAWPLRLQGHEESLSHQ